MNSYTIEAKIRRTVEAKTEADAMERFFEGLDAPQYVVTGESVTDSCEYDPSGGDGDDD